MAHVATAASRTTKMAFSDSDDDILASSLVVVSSVANQKPKLNLGAEKEKKLKRFHNLHTQFVKEGHKSGKLLQKSCSFTRFVAVAKCAVAHGDFLAR